MHQFNKYEISNVLKPSGIISLVYNLQIGMILLLTLPEMQILWILEKKKWPTYNYGEIHLHIEIQKSDIWEIHTLAYISGYCILIFCIFNNFIRMSDTPVVCDK